MLSRSPAVLFELEKPAICEYFWYLLNDLVDGIRYNLLHSLHIRLRSALKTDRERSFFGVAFVSEDGGEVTADVSSY